MDMTALDDYFERVPMKRFPFLILAMAGSIALTIACGGVEATNEVPDQQAREIKLVARSGEDTVSLNSYFPSKVTVRAGDTLTVTLGHPDEPTTISFLLWVIGTGFTASRFQENPIWCFWPGEKQYSYMVVFGTNTRILIEK